MGLINWFTSPSNKELLELLTKAKRDITDLRAEINTSKQRQRSFEQEVKTRRRTLQKPLQYATSNTSAIGSRKESNIYYGPLHDLSEIARAMDIEPYINQSIRKHREQILKDSQTLLQLENDQLIFSSLDKLCEEGEAKKRFLQDDTKPSSNKNPFMHDVIMYSP